MRVHAIIEHVAAEREPASISLFERRPAASFARSPLYILAFIATVAALWAAQVFLIPIVLAGLLSCGLEPFHRRLVAWHVPRSLAPAFAVAVTGPSE